VLGYGRVRVAAIELHGNVPLLLLRLALLVPYSLVLCPSFGVLTNFFKSLDRKIPVVANFPKECLFEFIDRSLEYILIFGTLPLRAVSVHPVSSAFVALYPFGRVTRRTSFAFCSLARAVEEILSHLHSLLILAVLRMSGRLVFAERELIRVTACPGLSRWEGSGRGLTLLRTAPEQIDRYYFGTAFHNSE
jgi:hypothetical protein